MILGCIAEREDITITDEEIDAILQEYVDQYGGTLEDIKAVSDMAEIRRGQLDVKVLDWLSDVVNVVTVEETEGELYIDDFMMVETEAETDTVEEDVDVAFVEDTEAE